MILTLHTAVITDSPRILIVIKLRLHPAPTRESHSDPTNPASTASHSRPQPQLPRPTISFLRLPSTASHACTNIPTHRSHILWELVSLPQLLRCLDDRHRHASNQVDINMTMEKPNTRVVGYESNNNVSLWWCHGRISCDGRAMNSRHIRDEFAIATSDDLKAMSVLSRSVWA